MCGCDRWTSYLVVIVIALTALQRGVPMTWEDSKTNIERAFPRYNRQQETRTEFYALTQGDLTVEMYSNKLYNQLQGRCEPRPTPADLLYHFSQGLKFNMRVDPSTGRLWGQASGTPKQTSHRHGKITGLPQGASQAPVPPSLNAGLG